MIGRLRVEIDAADDVVAGDEEALGERQCVGTLSLPPLLGGHDHQ
jgi:hypothetical protein